MADTNLSLIDAVDLLRSLERRVPERAGEVRFEERDGVGWIVLDNPGAHNALTARMMRELGEAVLAVCASEVAIVAVASAHAGTFCAGGHLVQVREALVAPEAARAMTLGMTAVLDGLWTAPPVVIALVEGAAIGGGLEIVSACDLVFAMPNARLDPAQVRLGVAAGWGGARRLARRLGRSAALRLLATGDAIPAQAGRELGLVDHVGVGPATRLLEEGAGALLGRPAAAVRALKAQMVSPCAIAQAEAFLSVWGGDGHRRALGLDP